MTQTRLIGFEAAAVRYVDSFDDDELAGLLADAVDRIANDDNGAVARPQDLRELAAVALVASRRLDGRAHA